MNVKIIEYILLCIIFYLIGSIPAAYLFLKYKTGKDITKEGSGNSGALNTLQVSGSKSAGFTVLVLDLLKGFIPSYLLFRVVDLPLEFVFIPVVLLVAGHNFSVWLGFKGGRGLATAAGICLAVSPVILLIWVVLFIISYGIYRNVHFGNIVATVILPLFVYVSKPILENLDNLAVRNFEMYFSFVTVLCLIVMLKHIGPFFELIKDAKKHKTKN
ncbi:MAG: glycerol-3-phosphate acyltransferase [Ignavibacteria bacterium]|nr:glycerol-3-phosphate acyltransferase [Ignavibacteria bacterium]